MEQKWFDEVKNHYNFVAENNSNERDVMFTCLYGSQNYGMATDRSDVDTKSFVFPSYSDIAFHQPLLSEQLVLSNGSHAEMKDYRDMLNNIRKQNMNFLETLFTPYVVVNNLWRKFYDSLHENREVFSRLDVDRGVKGFLGHMTRMYKCYFSGKDPKKAMHLFRLYDAMKRYALSDEPYENLLFKPNNLDFLMEVREGKIAPQKLEELCKLYMVLGETLVDEIPKHEINKKGFERLETYEYLAFDEGMRKYYF